MSKVFIYRPGQPVVFDPISPVPQWDGPEGLRAKLCELLDCDDPEHVTVLYKGRRGDMFVDEAGTLKRLPVNDAATSIYHAALTLRQLKRREANEMSPIYGPAVLFDEPVWA